jgi:uncharacterized protein YgiM (DUF1202 family)
MKSLKITLLILTCLLSAAIAAQAQGRPFNLDSFRADFQEQSGAATVIAARTNLRAAPDNQGMIVAAVNRGEALQLIGKIRTWYLVQTARHVGWIPGNAIRLGAPETTSSTGEESAGGQDNSPFTAEYVGGDVAPSIIVRNTTSRRLTIAMNSTTYNIRPNSTQTIQVQGGNYRYRASVPGIRPLSGNKEFRRGYQYTWEFRLVTTPVRGR